ncbi:MAG: tetratricopeptide repeat protein [Planctomycetes bacterium]|nr:tetratricopeptide repeat protein [Planctomycetota bacterium]
MAKTLNRSLVGGLTFGGMVVLAAAGFLLLANLPGRDPKVYEDEAKKHEGEKEWNKAGQAWVRAYQRDPEHNPEYLISAAKCAIEEGDVGAVRNLISQARIKDPQLRSASRMSAEIEFEVAKLFPSVPQWGKVLTDAQKLIAAEKDSALGHHALGQAYMNLQKEDATYRDKGREELKRALELDPGNADIVETLARDQWMVGIEKQQTGQRQEGEEIERAATAMVAAAIEKAPPEKTSDRSKLERLLAFYSLIKGDTDKAIAALTAMADKQTGKDGVDTQLMLGSIYLGSAYGNERMDQAKAEACFKKAISLDPGDGRAYQGLSQIYKARREREQDAAKRAELAAMEIDLFKKGLASIPKTKHFRDFSDNISRISFFSELCMIELDRAANSKDEAEKKAAIAVAEDWTNQLKREVDPASVEARFLTASILNAKGEYVAATKEAEAADRSNEAARHVRLQALLGELYARQAQWGAASKSLKKAIAIMPNSPMLRLRLGQVYLQMNEPSQALAELKPLEKGPMRDFMEKNETAIQFRAEAYRLLGQTELAGDELKKLAKSETGGDELREIRLLMTEQRYNEAEARIKPILSKDPGNESAVRMLFRVYEATDRMTDAKALLKSALSRAPDNELFRRLYLVILETERNDDATLAFLKEEKDPYARAMAMADFFGRREKLVEAMAALDEAEKIKPDSAELVDRQLRVAAAKKDWDRMARYVTKDGQLNADGTEGKIAQGRMAYAQGKYQDAVDLITAGLAKFPSNAFGWTYLGETYLAMKNRTADAKQAIAKALEIDPTNGFANRAMAQILMGEGNEKDAQKFIQAAARVIQDDRWLRQQTQVMSEKENPATGIATREKARRDNPNDIENLVFLARLYGDPKVAKYDKAAEIYREALKVSKNDLRLAREIARFFGREEVNRPQEGDQLLVDLMNAETDKSRKAEVAVCLGQFYEVQKSLATADRYFRLAVSLDASKEVLNSAGEYYARTNRFRDSVEYYNRLLQMCAAPEDAALAQSTHSRIIALWLALGDLDNAKKEIDAFVVKYPNDAQGMIYTGAYHRIGGDIQKAKEAFDAHLERDSNNAVALWQRGQMFMLMGRWQAAVDDLRKAKTFSPDGFLYQHRIALADALIELGRGDEAIVELRSIIDQKPDQTAVAEALIDAYARVRPPRYTDAENIVYTYMRLYPKEYKWPMILGRLGERMQKWDKAVQGYEKAAELARDRQEVIAALFNAYKQANRPKAMADYLSQMLSDRQLEQAPYQLSGLGWAYQQIGEKEKAMDTFDRALTAAGEDFIAYTRVVGDMASVLGKAEALSRAQSRAQADPKNIEKQKAVLHLLQASGKNDEALAACKVVTDLATRDRDIVFARLAQGMLLQQLGRAEEARTHYEAVLKVDAKQPLALNNLAYLLADSLNKPAEALPYAQQAVKASPNDPGFLDTLGYVLSMNGRHGEALGALFRARDQDKKNVAIQYHLGQTYERKGDKIEAQAWYERAKSLAQEQGDKQYLPKILKALGAA